MGQMRSGEGRAGRRSVARVSSSTRLSVTRLGPWRGLQVW